MMPFGWASRLRMIAPCSFQRRIITIEEPVEYRLPGVSQIGGELKQCAIAQGMMTLRQDG
jgi:hypothetical protein